MPTCAVCGQENPAAARFCFGCGTAFASSDPAPREERRLVSVIFVDLVGFTGRAERLDPEDVRALLTPYHDAVRNEIESFGGVVEKFIGDAVMGVFGAPTAFGDDAERAVRAALAVRDRVASASDPSLQLRIAVNTGEALVALEARPALGEAMVAGDVVNTAARLQSSAAPNSVVVGEETWRATREAIEYEPGPPVVAKGKADAVPIWVAVRPRTPHGERALSSTFVGRTRELTALADVWARVVEQRTPHLVTVVAAAGVGKSRLGVEFAQHVDGLGGLTVRGRSLPYRESSAYGAFANQLKQLCHVFENDSAEVVADKVRARVETLLGGSAAADVAGHLALLLGAGADTTLADRETLFFSIRCFVEAVARDQPTLLVFEDLHWADDGLLDVVEMLGGRLRDLPILVLVLARPELLDARPNWGAGLPAYTTLPLGPLAPDEAERLALERLAAISDHAILDRAGDVAQTAAGNPLFIEQLAAGLFESAGADEALPTTIRAIVAARLDALPPAERAVLLDAAVGGKVFWRGALERMRSDEALGEQLAALERRDFIRRETISSIEGEQQYTFVHMLIRDVAYELLPRRQRHDRHRHCAEFLESVNAGIGEAGAALARHWREAGEDAKALRYFASAAALADQGWAKERAVSLYRDALDLAVEDEDRRHLRRRLAVAQQAAFHVEDARALGARRVEIP